MKILVLGDSFASLDPIHSHWIQIWGDRNNHIIDFHGYPGQSHLVIVNEYWSQLHSKVYEYDMLVYISTNMFRHLKLNSNYNEVIAEDCLNQYTDDDNAYRWGLNGSLSNVTFNTEVRFIEAAFDYDNIFEYAPIKYILTSNMIAVRSLFLSAKKHNLITVMVETFWEIDKELELIKDDVDLVFKPQKCDHISKFSSNHFDLAMHLDLADDWDIALKDNIQVKTE